MKDERLIFQNLKNIRIAFIFQTICIIGILIVNGINNGFTHVTENPIWLVFMGSAIILGFLNLRAAVDHYESKSKKKKQPPFYQKIFLSLVIGAIFSLCTMLSANAPLKASLLSGAVVFICFLLTYSLVYQLKKNRNNEED